MTAYRRIARELLEEVRAFGADVVVIDGDLEIRDERGALTDGLRRRLAEHRLELLAFVRDALTSHAARGDG